MSRKSCLIRLFKTTVSCKLFTAIILSVFLGQPALTYAGVVIGGTRVVYLSNNADKSISVFSKEEKIPYLIQAWVDPFNKEDKNYRIMQLQLETIFQEYPSPIKDSYLELQAPKLKDGNYPVMVIVETPET